ncbi:MAG: glycosyltransferase [Elusimicrobia bacterium]|nr:glycosyltransferase [Elusimicrobiota bacterium]
MRRRTNLLFVIENSAYGGGEKVFSQLIRSLPQEKFDICCASRPTGRFYGEVRDFCRFLPLDLSSRFNLLNVPRLKAMMLANGIDIAHSQGARADFYCALAAARAGVKCVSTVAMPVEGFDVGFLKKRLYMLLAAFAARRTTAAVTVSGALEQQLKGRYPSVELIRNPVDLAEFDPSNFDATAVIERFGLRGRLVLGALGRLEWQKGYPDLIAAIGILLEKTPGLREKLVCLIAGTGSLEKQLRARAAAAGVAGNVVFCGEISNVRDLLSAIDIFVMPSLREGQPLALLEAMAMARPIAASDIPGINDTVVPGESAVLFKAGEPASMAGALDRLISDRALAAGLGRAARAAAEKAGLPAYIAAHEEFYRRLTEAR